MRGAVPAVIVGAVALAYLYQRMTAGNDYAKTYPATEPPEFQGVPLPDDSRPALRYFEPEEFGQWWPDMATGLLQKLDVFRGILGVPVMISPAPGALGRNMGPFDLSQHNVDMWGEVRAADVMVPGVDLVTAYHAARAAGFTGIGLYPEWKPYPGLHLDVRPGPLAQWSGWRVGDDQEYRGIEEVIG